MTAQASVEWLSQRAANGDGQILYKAAKQYEHSFHQFIVTVTCLFCMVLHWYRNRCWQDSRRAPLRMDRLDL